MTMMMHIIPTVVSIMIVLVSETIAQSSTFLQFFLHSDHFALADDTFLGYNLRVQLLNFNASNGLLANNENCDPFYFVGRKCNIGLQICVELIP
jgi:hypothetical protein